MRCYKKKLKKEKEKQMMKLIDNWKDAWKTLTVQISLAGIAVTQILAQLPDWGLVPQSVKDLIPPEHLPTVTTIFFIAAIVGRVKSQPKLYKNKETSVEEEKQKEE